MGEKMKKTILSIVVFLFIFFSVMRAGYTTMDEKEMFSLEELGNIYLSMEAKELLKYKGKEKPFTMELIPNVGSARAFPRALDVLAVLGSERALDILEKEGDTEYEYYYEQLNKLM